MKHSVTLTIASLLSILLPVVSLVGQHRPRDRAGTALNLHWGAHPGRLAVRNSGARRTAIGVRHHPPRIAPWGGHAPRPHEGGRTGRGQDCRLQRSLVLGLDAPRARRDRYLLPHPLSARTVEPAKGSVQVVQQFEFGECPFVRSGHHPFNAGSSSSSASSYEPRIRRTSRAVVRGVQMMRALIGVPFCSSQPSSRSSNARLRRS